MALSDALEPILAAGGIPMGTGDRPAGVTNKPFVIVWEPAPARAASRLNLATEETTVLTCHCYGLTPAAAAVAERKLAEAMYGLYRTEVDGRQVGYPEQLTASPMTRDDDVSPPLYDLVVEWRLRTTPIN